MAESNRKGSFWLFEAGQRSLDATWELYQNNAQYGWYAGGFVPAGTSLVDRVDFANDSPTAASPRGSLTAARFYQGAVGNANYGWFGGGQTPAPVAVSAIERIQYSNDTANATVRGSFPAIISQMGSASNNYYGWFAGGQGIGLTSTILRIDFANDSPVSASIRGPLSIAEGGISGCGNQYYGWFGGGQAAAPAQVSHVQRIDYANDSPTSATQRGTLSSNRSNTGAVANTNYGWWGGGYVFPAVFRSNIDRIDFANDSPTAAVPRGPLTIARAGVRPSGNQNYGWFTGASTPAIISNVDRIDYSNDTVVSSPRGGLTTARGTHGATAGIAVYGTPPVFLSTSTLLTPVANYGWWAGGYQGGTRSTVDRINFSNDSPTTASARGFLTVAANGNGATSNNYYGWVNQGNTSVIDRIEMSNDLVTATPRGSIPHPGGNLQDRAAAGNANFGWHSGGGTPGGRRSTIDRINYANDTSASLTRGPLPSDRYAHAATSNDNYGWHAGGNPGLAQITRIDYSNDSPAATGNRGSFPSANEEMAGTGNANYGWFSGGSIGAFRSTIYRVDYSNDLVSSTLRGILTKDRANFRGSGNSLFGWVGPGNNGDSSIDRIDYSNDTANASARGNLSQTRYTQASFSNYVAQPITATAAAAAPAFYVAPYAYGSSIVGTSGSANYGWWGGGTAPTNISSVDRLDFSNDTTAASPRGTLSYTNAYIAAAGNQNFGWFTGGFPAVSTVSRIDYSNDSVVGIARGFIATARGLGGAVSNSNYGWFGFGTAGTVIDRIDFSNDSPATGSLRGFGLVSRSSGPGAVNNTNYGWFSGGIASVTSVERIDFANDSPTISSTRGFRNTAAGQISSSGNASYGWFANGNDVTPGSTIFSNIERIDYSNDTIRNSVRSNSSEARSWASGAGNANYGWHGGGFIPGGIYSSRIDRIDYANDTNANALTRGSLTLGKAATGSTGNYVK